MGVTVYIPTPFRTMTGNRAYVDVEGATIAEVLDNLDRQFPGVHDLIYSSDHPGHRGRGGRWRRAIRRADAGAGGALFAPHHHVAGGKHRTA